MAGIQNTIIFSQGEKLQQSTLEDISGMQTVSTDISRINHTGNPQGVVSANPSSLCHDPVSGDIYYKQEGTGNTGWIRLNSGLQRFIGPDIDLKTLGSTVIFTPIADIIFYQISFQAVNISGTPSVISVNFGTNATAYDNIKPNFVSIPTINGQARTSPIDSFVTPTPAGTPVRINVTTEDSGSTTNIQRPCLIGYYI